MRKIRSKTKTELCSRMIVKVYIQLTEFNRCVNVAVQKSFLWRILKESFPAIYRLIIVSGKIASKPKRKVFQAPTPWMRDGLRLPAEPVLVFSLTGSVVREFPIERYGPLVKNPFYYPLLTQATFWKFWKVSFILPLEKLRYCMLNLYVH